MKTIKKDELYRNLSRFLQAKGIEFKDGSITHRIRQGCGLLTDTINLASTNLGKAKATVDQKLDQMRQVIHEKTAPKPAPAEPRPAAKPADKKSKAAAENPQKKTAPKAKKSSPRPKKTKGN